MYFQQEIHTGHRQENSRGRSSSDAIEESLKGRTLEESLKSRTWDESLKSRTWTSISRLTLPVSKADNNAILRCLAEHPALLVGENLVSSKFLTIHCKFWLELLSTILWSWLIQWAPLNGITYNGISRIIESLLGTFSQSHQLEKWLVHCKKEFG